MARKGYGRDVLRYCGFRCSYCGLYLGEFEGWLQFSVDHVVPQQMVALGYPAEWVLDEANVVACCRPCNDLFNRDPTIGEIPTTLEEFFEVRDRVFAQRRERIMERRDEERRWFEEHVAPQASMRAMTAQAIYGQSYKEPDISGTGLPGRARRDALRRMGTAIDTTTGGGLPAPSPRGSEEPH